MAQRRMFSPDIVCSDPFLDMPASSQALYYTLGMFADDDGFVNPRKIMRMLGAAEDDLKILLAKRFVLDFPDGVIVIKHWRMNNLVRKDWYKPTLYTEHKMTLFIKDRGAYTLDSTQGRPAVDGSLTSPLTQVRLGKVRLDTSDSGESQGVSPDLKESETYTVPLDGDGAPSRKSRAVADKRPEAEIKAVFDLFGPSCYSMLRRNKTQRVAVLGLLEAKTVSAMQNAIEFAKEHREDKFCPVMTTPYELSAKWGKLLDYKKQNGY